MKQLLIMCSVPGGGKGYWIEHNAPEGAVVCSADHYFYELGNGTYAFDPTKLGKAHASCQAKAVGAMERGEACVIIDNTNLHAKHMKAYLRAAREHGYTPEIVRITPKSGMDAFWRNKHGVPLEVHQRMQKEFVRRDVPQGVKVREVYEK